MLFYHAAFDASILYFSGTFTIRRLFVGENKRRFHTPIFLHYSVCSNAYYAHRKAVEGIKSASDPCALHENKALQVLTFIFSITALKTSLEYSIYLSLKSLAKNKNSFSA